MLGTDVSGLLFGNKILYGAVSFPIGTFGPYTNNGLDEGYTGTVTITGLSINVSDFTGVAVEHSAAWTSGGSSIGNDEVVHYDTELWVTVESIGATITGTTLEC